MKKRKDGKVDEVRRLHCVFTWARITEHSLLGVDDRAGAVEFVSRGKGITPATLESPESCRKTIWNSSSGLARLVGRRKIDGTTFVNGKQPPGSVFFARGLPVKHCKPTEIESRITRTSPVAIISHLSPSLPLSLSFLLGDLSEIERKRVRGGIVILLI